MRAAITIKYAKGLSGVSAMNPDRETQRIVSTCPKTLTYGVKSKPGRPGVKTTLGTTARLGIRLGHRAARRTGWIWVEKRVTIRVGLAMANHPKPTIAARKGIVTNLDI